MRMHTYSCDVICNTDYFTIKGNIFLYGYTCALPPIRPYKASINIVRYTIHYIFTEFSKNNIVILSSLAGRPDWIMGSVGNAAC